MTSIFEEELKAPEPFEIPELSEFYRFPFEKKRNGEWMVCRLQRNDPCMCGSGRKQKKCCGEFDSHKYRRLIDLILDESLKEYKQDDENNKQEGILIEWPFRRF